MLAQQQHSGNSYSPRPGANLIRPSPVPANAPTEQEILAGGARQQQHHQQQQQQQHMLRHDHQAAAAALHLHQQRLMLMQQQQHQQHQQQQQVQMDASQQPRFPPPGAMAPPDLLALISLAPVNRDALARPEAITLKRALDNGDATPAELLQQFTHGHLGQSQREILVNVLKEQQEKGALPKHSNLQPHPHMPNPHVVMQQQQQQQQQMQQQMMMAAAAAARQQHHSPRSSPLHDLAVLQQQQQQMQQQQQPQRLSPSFMQLNLGPAAIAAAAASNGGGGGAPPPPPAGSNGNNLAVSPTQRRVPSPQEMAQLTQQIMQQALIRRKLDEQKENYRRRHHDDGVDNNGQQRQLRPQFNNPQEGPSNSGSSKQQQRSTDSPLFTPTVVMKKLAADRRDSDPRPQVPELRVNQQTPSEPAAAAAASSSAAAAIGPDGDGPVSQLHQQMVRPPAMSMSAQNEGGMMPLPGTGGTGGLARFFSPEVLAQAHSGGAPAMPPLPTQKALTLEELELQAAAAAVRM